MPASQDKILALLDQPHLSEEDIQFLLDYLDDPGHEKEFQLIVQERFLAKLQDEDDGHYGRAVKLLQQMHERIGNRESVIMRVHRIHFLRTAWLRYAAAAILLFGIGAFLYVSRQKEKPSVTQTNPVPVQNDVAPGGSRATLTLADGSKIVLDSAANGKLAEQDNSTITKNGDKIIYETARSVSVTPLAYNTMSTPRGGQYQLTMPDGTRVWLNAESSIIYPVSFAKNERRVSITGEAYFEVTHNKKQPFKVETAEQTIEVLGTKFNVNAYTNEEYVKTTLLEGAVKIELNAVHTSLTLKPGQQGQLKDQQLSLAANPDIEQVMAWKNGFFNFNRLPVKEVLKQLTRWYDVEVVYEGKVPQVTFGGEMERNLNLSQVLKVLSTLGVKCRIEGKKVIVEEKE